MVTSPPYHAGKDFDSDATFEQFLAMLGRVLAETHRVLEPGGRAVVNVANLGRRPYVPLAAIVTGLACDLGFFPRGEVIWVKASGASSNCAWGSWCSASNPTLRDLHEYCLCFSKGRMDRARRGRSTIERDESMMRPRNARRRCIPPTALRRSRSWSEDGHLVLGSTRCSQRANGEIHGTFSLVWAGGQLAPPEPGATLPERSKRSRSGSNVHPPPVIPQAWRPRRQGAEVGRPSFSRPSEGVAGQAS